MYLGLKRFCKVIAPYSKHSLPLIRTFSLCDEMITRNLSEVPWRKALLCWRQDAWPPLPGRWQTVRQSTGISQTGHSTIFWTACTSIKKPSEDLLCRRFFVDMDFIFVYCHLLPQLKCKMYGWKVSHKTKYKLYYFPSQTIFVSYLALVFLECS